MTEVEKMRSSQLADMSAPELHFYFKPGNSYCILILQLPKRISQDEIGRSFIMHRKGSRLPVRQMII